MPRLARLPITIPTAVEISVTEHQVTVKGPKGSLSRLLPRQVQVSITPEGVKVLPRGESPQARVLVGTFAAHLKNMIKGDHGL